MNSEVIKMIGRDDLSDRILNYFSYNIFRKILLEIKLEEINGLKLIDEGLINP